ncbi:sarcosine oxidase subunit gamma family protein [Aliihoeflea sp. 40Bstr573]|uniref:sarcosine oxidase subunit gamma family protein n=1 Tax=Aliihoeflea sp. 40Bstr573 TaxID=2696467 RepID=UPI0020955BB0|nr:sarcosine oxidase subunit gamma family protein [Aliihoeflea sp. 40Bstr573]MCO6387780.1 sarcosine oxidase subunit gamma [Aliihoeflea sp. 40Bstr573]
MAEMTTNRIPLTAPPTQAALADRAPVVREGVTLEALPEGTILHLLARPTQVAAPFADKVAAAGLDLRVVAPGQWFATAPTVMSGADLVVLSQALKPEVDVVDQSHGRVGIVLHGPLAARVLAKGTAVDLDPSAFPVGRSATTLVGHIAAHLTRVNAERFEIVVQRGFAGSLFDDLSQMSLEFARL